MKLTVISDLIKRVNINASGVFRRDSELIAILPSPIANIIKSKNIYLSEFVVAKVKGKILGFDGHPEITDEMFVMIPDKMSNPIEILEDTRSSKKYLFINIDPLSQIVVEVSRIESNKTEINTVHRINLQELKRLENKFPVVFSSGETPGLSHACIP
jgi:hypothetical protein